jgi:hypothetical protein
LVHRNGLPHKGPFLLGGRAWVEPEHLGKVEQSVSVIAEQVRSLDEPHGLAGEGRPFID